VEQVDFRANGAVRMNTVKPSDRLNRLTAIQSAVAGANQLPQAFAFQKEFYKP
jgi:hypothetical protein